MRKFLVAAALMLMNSLVVSAQTISPDEVAKHIGEKVTVCGKVFGGRYFDQSSKITLLNMGAAYPNSPLTIVIEEDSRKNFNGKPEELYANKEVCVTGTVKDYKGKPQITITKEDEIVVKKG